MLCRVTIRSLPILGDGDGIFMSAGWIPDLEGEETGVPCYQSLFAADKLR